MLAVWRTVGGKALIEASSKKEKKRAKWLKEKNKKESWCLPSKIGFK